MQKKALGKGLQALLPAYADTKDNNSFEVNINEVEPNLNQPRKLFDEDSMVRLSRSIKEVGIIQPIVVKKEGSIYRIVAGERRWRAARLAGLKTVPVIIKDLSELLSMEVALIENLQREDLNPIEEARGYEQLIDEFQMTQDQISDVVCKSRSTISNSIRLLKLSSTIQEHLVSKKISSGHARALLTISDDYVREKLAEEIISSSLNVRQIEDLVKDSARLKKYYPAGVDAPKKKRATSPLLDERAIALGRIEIELKNIFGANVKMTSSGEKGKIVINYYNDDHLQRILDAVGIGDIFK
ncbi:MAG: ParB/RepB/Spo0J family partition protein [Oscillospiraceae bacterium]|nr:ParB/RepB/Spo0J family partition protein [Oscillospiraceae bacterium]